MNQYVLGSKSRTHKGRDSVTVVGLLLAAGRGSRMGIPKALVRSKSGVPWLESSHETLAMGGCDSVLVVLGAEAEEAQSLIPEAETIHSKHWTDGMGESLADGLREIPRRFPDADTVLVHLVDLPDVGSDVVRRLLPHAEAEALVRASYAGKPGHPVLIGKAHWKPLLAELSGDEGARRYLNRHQAATIECGDLASGHDVDTREGI